MAVYIMSQLTIHDRDRYTQYEEGFMEVFEQFNGKMLSVDEDPKVLMGDWTATRSVLIEFPDKKSAYAWLMSEEYQEISKHRIAASTANSILVQGLD